MMTIIKIISVNDVQVDHKKKMHAKSRKKQVKSIKRDLEFKKGFSINNSVDHDAYLPNLRIIENREDFKNSLLYSSDF